MEADLASEPAAPELARGHHRPHVPARRGRPPRLRGAGGDLRRPARPRAARATRSGGTGASGSRSTPELWFLAEDGDELAGILLARPERGGDETLGWVSVLGVRRPLAPARARPRAAPARVPRAAQPGASRAPASASTARTRPAPCSSTSGPGCAWPAGTTTGRSSAQKLTQAPSACVPRMARVAKASVKFACTECGQSTARWLGQVPRLRLVRDARRGGARPAATASGGPGTHADAPGRGRGRGGGADPDRPDRARPRPGRRDRACVARTDRRRAGGGEVDAATDGARVDLARAPRAARDRRGVGRPGQAARRAPRRRGRRSRSSRRPRSRRSARRSSANGPTSA